MSAPGRLTAAELTPIQGSAQLLNKTSRAWKRLKAAALSKLGRRIACAGDAAAYRSAAVQHAMHLAGAGHDPVAKARWNLNPHSTVSIADDPNGTHEHGDRVDIVGTAMDGPFLALAAEYGFYREFGAADPNHFRHDGKTATAPFVVPKPAPKTATYVVRAGDTLASIARLYSDPRDKKADLSVDDLLRLNPGVVPEKLRIGQKLRIA